jgi:nitrogen fixation protein FixH
MLARTGFLLILLQALFAAPGAYAQGHAHSHHGGQEVKIGAYEAELVVAGSEITLYVHDAKDQKVDASGFSATAVVLAKGSQQKSVDLAPAGENKLTGRFDFPVEGKFRATVTLKTASGEVGKGRFNLDVKR